MMFLMGRAPKLTMMLFGLPLAGGVALHPQALGAFIGGAGAGLIVVLPLVWFLLLGLRLRSPLHLLRMLLRWPVLVGLIFVLSRLYG